MALGYALVDEARVYERRKAAGQRVEGSTRLVEYAGPWIKARLTVPPAPEAVDAPVRGRRRVPSVPTVMLLARDRVGGDVHVTTEHRLGIVAKELFGTEEVIYEVTGDPEPIRKRRKVIGWTVALRRVVDNAPAQLAGVG